MNHWFTMSILVNDQPGVLQSVAGLFGRRGFNIESITVGACEDPDLSRMVIVTNGDSRVFEQIKHQLEKLIDVVEVVPLSAKPMVARELSLIKVAAEPARRPEIMTLVETFRCAVIDVSPTTLTVQVVGETDKIDAMIELLAPYDIIELCRTGVTAMARGSATQARGAVESAGFL